MFHVNPLPSIKYQVLFSLKNNEKVFINVAAVMIGAFKRGRFCIGHFVLLQAAVPQSLNLRF